MKQELFAMRRNGFSWAILDGVFVASLSVLLLSGCSSHTKIDTHSLDGDTVFNLVEAKDALQQNLEQVREQKSVEVAEVEKGFELPPGGTVETPENFTELKEQIREIDVKMADAEAKHY